MKFLKRWFGRTEEKKQEIEKIEENFKEAGAALEIFVLMQKKIERNMEVRGEFKRI